MGRFTEAATASREQRVSAECRGKEGAPAGSWTAAWAGTEETAGCSAQGEQAQRSLCCTDNGGCSERAEECFGFSDGYMRIKNFCDGRSGEQ